MGIFDHHPKKTILILLIICIYFLYLSSSHHSQRTYQQETRRIKLSQQKKPLEVTNGQATKIVITIPPRISPSLSAPGSVKYPTNFPTVSAPTSYHSKYMNIILTIPTGFNIDEGTNSMFLKNNQGEIVIGRVGTNENTIDDFLYEGDYRSKLPTKIDRKHIVINGLDSVVEIEEYPTRSDLDNKAYFFYKDHGVYSLYTNSKSLYSDLDQIVQSLRFTS